MLQRELETAVRLAREASASILEHYSGEVTAVQKLGVDEYYEPVTAADIDASRIIVHGLEREFPDDAVLSEERVDDPRRRLSKERVWIIDPIDGTAGFVKKDGDFAVQIGLAFAGEPVLGVVLLPFHKALYYGVRGEGAFVQYEGGELRQLKASDKTEFSEMTLAFSRNHPSKGITRIRDEFGFANGVQRGSIGLKVGLIAEQACDLYIHLSPRTKIWDTCGPQIILEEAGGRLTDLFGETYRYDVEDLQNHGGIVATNGAAHNAVIERLQPILQELGRPRHTAHNAPGR